MAIPVPSADIRKVAALLAAVLATPPAAFATDILAHRGAPTDFPENTLPAVQRAWEVGADAVEVDIHLSSDGRIVVIHDDDTKRVAGVNRKVREQTFDELRALDVGRWMGPQFAGARIPTLLEVLATVPEGRRVILEIKPYRPGDHTILGVMEKDMAASGLGPERFSVISFDAALLKELKARNPRVECLWLKRIHWFPVVGFEPEADSIIAGARAAGVDGVDVKARRSVDAAFIRKVKEAGLRIFVYTVDDPAHAEALIRAGVDGLTTNRAAEMLEVRDRVK